MTFTGLPMPPSQKSGDQYRRVPIFWHETGATPGGAQYESLKKERKAKK